MSRHSSFFFFHIITIHAAAAALSYSKVAMTVDMTHSLPIQRKKDMATHSGILAWKIPWMEEPGRLQSVGPQRV